MEDDSSIGKKSLTSGGSRDELDEDDDNVAVEKNDNWAVFAHVYDKIITVTCGDGAQKVKWLAHVAIGKSFSVVESGSSTHALSMLHFVHVCSTMG